MLIYGEKIYSTLNVPVDERTTNTLITMMLIDHVNNLGLDGYKVISFTVHNDHLHWLMVYQFEIEKVTSDNID